jgi:CubicO group peptidase (beta-lactamase class C family)
VRLDARFDAVGDVFWDIVASQAGTGAAVAACCDGETVVDLWGGFRDQARRLPWERDSLVQPYSVSKAFAAACALTLVDAGRLDLDSPVRRYWPEFQAPATVRHVLSHQAGVVALDEPCPTEAFYDWEGLCALLAAQPPAWPPGTAHGESALFFGHLVGELVRRVDGRGLGRFLREAVCGPLGLDFSFGLDPSQRQRAVELTGFPLAVDPRPPLYQRATANPPGARDPAVVNSEQWRAAEIPAINGHGTARAIAEFYAAFGAGRVVGPSLLAEATAIQCSGVDRVMGQQQAWGLGFGIDPDGYGMGGLGGSYGRWCPDGGYSFAFVTGTLGSHDREIRLENCVRECLALPPLTA